MADLAGTWTSVTTAPGSDSALVNGQLTGPMVGHYLTAGANSTLNLVTTTTRAP